MGIPLIVCEVITKPLHSDRVISGQHQEGQFLRAPKVNVLLQGLSDFTRLFVLF